MGKLRSFVLVVVLLGMMVPVASANQMKQDEEASVAQGPAGFVSGSTIIVARQSQTGPGTDFGLGTGNWIVSIIDVTNFGTATANLPLSDMKLDLNGTQVGAAANDVAAKAIGIPDVPPTGIVPIPVDTTVRVAAAFSLNVESPLNLKLSYGDQGTFIDGTIIPAMAPSELPAVVNWMGQQGTVQGLGEGGILDLALAGAATPTAMAGIDTPPTDGCFGAESLAAIQSLSGGVVWVQSIDPAIDASLVWYWDPGQGHLALLNQTLLEQGFAGTSLDNDAGAFSGWLATLGSSAESAETGLWSVCRGLDGEWINPPTPTPVPTKTADEVRAEYIWVDTRDLVIRPFEFEGEKIAVQGSVFNIDADPSGFTGIQIWLDGGSEAAVIGYYGDSTGIYEGTWITVYGEGAGTFEGTNSFGGTISQPLIEADIIDY